MSLKSGHNATGQAAASHVVKPGETLSGIAHRLGVSWQALGRANGITSPTHLKVGVTLHIPPSTADAHKSQSKSFLAAPHLPAQFRGPPAQSSAGGPRLGDLSMRFETGYFPGKENQAAAKVSSGKQDPGGVSYGAYQLASSAAGGRQVQAFLRHEGKPWADKFIGKDPTKAGADFEEQWKDIASSQPEKFFQAQHAFIERSHFSPVVSHVKAVTGLDIVQRSRAVQNVVWSMSVQHGKAAKLVTNVVVELGPQGALTDHDYDRKLIENLYDMRNDYVDQLGLGKLKSRYTLERQDAVKQLGTP